MKKLLFIAFLFLSLSFSCEKENIDVSDYEYVRYGTSFGECLGYCAKNIKISDSTINFEKSGWDGNGTLPVVTDSNSLSHAQWSNLINKIDINSFLQLDTIIGCPDCADGGAEWIEIKLKGVTHKVVFEYHNEPQQVKNYIGDLRGYLNIFENQPQ